MKAGVYLKLSIMMFLQYAVWGAWAVSMGSYMGETLKFTGVQIGAIYSTTAIAAMISPLFMGYIADRLFATERMIGVLHLIGAGLLGAAAYTQDFNTLYPIMIVYSICYMPTLALTNSISFANIGDPEKEFPYIRIWGTWGWIIVGWVVGFVLDGTTNTPLLLAAGASGLLGVFSFALPHTPPKGTSQTSDEPKGASVLQLLSDPSFLVFVVCSFLICIPLSFYYGFANVFLTETDAPVPTALQTLGQMSEVGFMAAMPYFIVRLGVKRMLAIGMLAWVIRYFCFGSLSLPLVVFGLFLHGVCYDFFFVASQIYVDNRVGPSQRASAQSFIAFVTLGLGMFVGAYLGGLTFDQYPPTQLVTATVVDVDGKSEETKLTLPNWDPTGKEGIAAKYSLSVDGSLKIDEITDDFVVAGEKEPAETVYPAAALTETLTDVDTNNDGSVSRVEWRVAQQHDWFHIWLWPAIWAGVTCVLFWVGFKDPKVSVEEMAAEAPVGAGEGPEPQVG